MSDAGDEIQVEAPVEVEVTTEAPKGKMSVEEALQVCKLRLVPPICQFTTFHYTASPEERPCS